LLDFFTTKAHLVYDYNKAIIDGTSVGQERRKRRPGKSFKLTHHQLAACGYATF
jgi:hypothetical protein